jgi:uncharacterized protein
MLEKLENLKRSLLAMKRVLIAFSGGVDSTFLLFVARETLGRDNVLAVIAESPTYPGEEVKAAIKTADALDADLRLIRTEEFSDENFLCNSKERCYYCKKELFEKLKAMANEQGFPHILDGSNYNDLADYRPGSRAKAEFDVKSPLQDVGLTKEEIRMLSKEAGLPTWAKPAMACLASRIPYGRRIDEAVLKMVSEGEKYLRSIGFTQLRVRHHDTIARIEVDKELLPQVMAQSVMDGIVKKFEALGYLYVTLDLKGYRPGSMNDGLGPEPPHV